MSEEIRQAAETKAFFEKRDRVIKMGDKITQRVMNLPLNAELAINPPDLDNYYRICHNESKGETPSMAFDKGLKFIKYNYGIICIPPRKDYLYIFIREELGAIEQISKPIQPETITHNFYTDIGSLPFTPT